MTQPPIKGAPPPADVPSLVHASGPQLAAQFMAAFQKTIRSATLYARNNQLLNKFYTDAYSLYGALTREMGDLELNVRADKLKMGDDTVLQDSDREAGLPFRLYREGVRRITFQAGMDADEMRELINIFGARPGVSTVEDDVVTMLWRAALPHVKYITVDIGSAAYSPAGAPAQDPDPETADQDQAVRRELDTLLSAIYQGGGAVPADAGIRGLSIGADDLLALKQLGEDRQGEMDAITHFTARTIFPIDPSVLAGFRASIENETDAQLMDRALDVLLSVLFSVRTGAETKKVIEQLVALFDSLLLGRDFRGAAGLVDRIRTYSAPSPDGEAADLKNTAIVRQLVKVFTSEQRLTAVSVALNDMQQNAATMELARLLASLGQDDPALLLTMLPAIQSPQHRRLLCDVIIGIGLPPLSKLVPYVNHGEWFVGRDALYLIGKSSELEAGAIILEACEHTHPRVRQQALSMLGPFPPGPADMNIVKALQDADAMVRQTAVRLAAHRKLDAAADVLKEVVSSADFGDRDLAEIRTYLMAYASVAGDAAVPVLDRILNPAILQKGMALLDRLRTSVDAAGEAQKVDLRIATAAALGAIDTSGAIASLQKGARSVIPAVKTACLKALHKGAESLPDTEKKG